VTPCPKPRGIDFDAIPENDPATCDVIAAGRTMGVFQIESPAMRGLLRMMKARTLEEVAQALALIRPGAAEYGSKELFIKRLRGEAEVEYPHPELKSILGDTRGVCIFQEQVMQISQVAGELSLAEADLIRRASAKFSGRSARERLRRKFLQAAGMMGLTSQQREETWMMVEKIRGVRFLQSACRDVCGHLLPHGVFEDALSGGISGGDVQRGRGILSRVGRMSRKRSAGASRCGCRR